MNIFSTYKAGENRVTGSFLAVLRSLSLDRMQSLLSKLLEDSNFELIQFVNQPSQGADGVPDAMIQSTVCLLIETKVKLNSVNLPQLQRHLKRLSESSAATKRLLVLTPDKDEPKAIAELNTQQVAWSSFADLNEAIEEILSDRRQVVSERETFLLRELQNMLEAEHLLANQHDIVVVAARNAWPEYQALHAYICQADRPFQNVTHLAFYASRAIQPVCPRILDIRDNVEIKAGGEGGAIGQLVERLIAEARRPLGGRFKIMILSAPDAAETIKLDSAVLNDKVSEETGIPVGFTMGQRYVSRAALLKAKKTSDLE